MYAFSVNAVHGPARRCAAGALFGAAALVGCAVALPASASADPGFGSVERMACALIGPRDSDGHRCAIRAVHVSAVSPDWVFVDGVGYYGGTDQPPSLGEDLSDENPLILNVRTGRSVGPAHLGFCGPPAPDTSAVPIAVLADWGLVPCATPFGPS